ncbi:MAG: YlxR family protein [Cyanobacteria bacterium P01_H01_bin.119]
MKPNIRRCVSCRRLASKSEFWRIVRRYPTGTVELEQGAGRSAYLCSTSDCLKLAQKKDRLGRSLKAKVPTELYQQLWAKLASESPVAGASEIERL